MPFDVSNRGIHVAWLPVLLGLLAVGFMWVRGCQTGPFGRNQVVALTPAQENQLGAQTFQEVLSKSSVRQGGPVVDKIKEIGMRLARAAESEEFLRATKLKPQKFEWEFRLVESRQVNAFCLPGGKVVVYTGIIPVCETEAGLATVMGHEIGHALAHHGAERMAQQQSVQILQQSASMSLGDMDPQQRQAVMGMLGAGAQFGVLLPFSRKHESEADHLGLLMMSAAGYDPKASVMFWKRMDKASKSGVPEYKSTHPSHETRVRDLEGWLEDAHPLYEKSQQHADRPLPR
jgi:predicted Zn-dependent protease